MRSSSFFRRVALVLVLAVSLSGERWFHTAPSVVRAQQFAQQAKLIASDGASSDQFGYSIAVSGDTAVVGAPFDDLPSGTSQGSAYVFVRSGNNWVQQAKLTANDSAANDEFGFAVAISGETIVVGAHRDDNGANSNQGSAYVFVRNGSLWTQQQKLTANDGAANDDFGFAVAVNGETVVAGARYDDLGPENNQGSAYVFVRSGGLWTQQAKLTANDGAANDEFGHAVAVSNETVLVGARADDIGTAAAQGSAYVFVRSGASWAQQAKLIASDGASSDGFGFSVGLDGATAIIGAPFDNLGATDQGSAYVFTRNGTSWAQQDKLTANDGAAGDRFGKAVAISGETAVAGAYYDDVNATNQGSAYVYMRSGTSWPQQQKLTASDGASSDNFGHALAISGATILAGAPLDDLETRTGQGSAYVFATPQPPCPTVTSLTPTSGAPGSSVIITGANFNRVTAVRFTNNVPAIFTINSATQITATVPSGASDGPVTISAPDCPDAPSGVRFTVTPCLAVSLPDLTAGAGALTVPLNVTDTTGRNIISFDATISFDPAVLRLQNPPSDRSGTLSSAMTVTTNSPAAGQLRISAFGAAPLTGAGVLLNLKFDVSGAPQSCSNLSFVNFRFNEGQPCPLASNGRVCLISVGTISGAVSYCVMPKPVPGVALNLTGAALASATTDAGGNYQLLNLNSGAYTLAPSRSGDANGVSSFDAALVAQHAVGSNTLTPCQQLAGDASNNGELSSFDAALIAQFAVGSNNPASSAGLWKFTPPNRAYANLSGAQINQNFAAVLVGDVSGNWTPGGGSLVEAAPANQASIAAQQAPISLPSVTDTAGASLTIPITIGDLTGKGVIAYDFELTFDQTVLRPQSTPHAADGTLSSGMTITPRATAGSLHLSAFATTALTGAGTLLKLKFDLIGAGGSGSTLTWRRFLLNETLQTSLTHGRVAVNRAVASVSAASFNNGPVAAESIAAAFGTALATTTQAAATTPLPTSLAGTTVRVRDSGASERLAPLFFVAPTQINYLLPAGTAVGPATVTVTGADGALSVGNVNIAAIAPGLFTASADGQGLPAAVALHIKADGTQSFEPVARFDPAQSKFVAVPIDLGAATDQVFLLLFGTGLRFHSGLAAVTAQVGGVNAEVTFAGAQGGLAGLDQINLRLPRALAGRGEVDIMLTVDGKAANTVRVAIK